MARNTIATSEIPGHPPEKSRAFQDGTNIEQAVDMLNEHAAALDTVETVSLFLFRGAGDPETVVTAPVGSLYLRTDGGTLTTLYVKESGAGNTGWAAK